MDRVKDVFNLNKKGLIVFQPTTMDDLRNVIRLTMLERLTFNLSMVSDLCQTVLQTFDYLAPKVFTIEELQTVIDKGNMISDKVSGIIDEKVGNDPAFDFGLYTGVMKWLEEATVKVGHMLKTQESRFYPIIPLLAIVGRHCQVFVEDNTRLSINVSPKFHESFCEGFKFFKEEVERKILNFNDCEGLAESLSILVSMISLLATLMHTFCVTIAEYVTNKVKELGGVNLSEKPDD